MTDLFAPLAADDTHLATLRDLLADEAAAGGDLDLAYRVHPSPVGDLLLAATVRGLVRVAYPAEGHEEVLDGLADRFGSRVLAAPRRLDGVARQLDEYFGGYRHTFDVDLDGRLASGFRLDVLRELRRITYGTTHTYAQVAASAGRPKAVRAVGTACARNPLPIVVPCHRVVRSDGSLGGYLAGPEVKARLLEIEGAAHRR